MSQAKKNERTHCRKGHLRSEVGIYLTPSDGSSRCRACRKDGDHGKRKRARRERRALIRLLGGSCMKCGTTDMNILEIDHIAGADVNFRPLSIDQRVALYKRELPEGKLQVLCRSCNTEKGRPPGAPVFEPPEDRKHYYA